MEDGSPQQESVDPLAKRLDFGVEPSALTREAARATWSTVHQSSQHAPRCGFLEVLASDSAQKQIGRVPFEQASYTF